MAMKSVDKQPSENVPDFKQAEERRAILVKSIQDKKRKKEPLTQEEQELANTLLEEERIDDQPRFGRY
jgi:hypothetical protein